MLTPIWFGQARNSAKYAPSASFTYLTLCQCVHITLFPLAQAVLKTCQTAVAGFLVATLLLLMAAMAEGTSGPGASRKRAMSRQQYLDSLRLPSESDLQRISAIQRSNEAKIGAKYHSQTASQDEHRAATVIQKAYRGYRDRRQLDGMILDPSARWTEALREVRYRSATLSGRRAPSDLDGARSPSPSNSAREKWRRVGQIAEHAAGEDRSPTRYTDGPAPSNGTLLDMRYFLEMVDTKHRYGANLQVYHEAWRRAATKANFFEWLDHGEGRSLSLPGCSRERLDKERIRYLSREERRDYEVHIDPSGRLRWLKNGELITTSSEKFKDSVHGVVPIDSPEPPATPPEDESDSFDSDDHSLDSSPAHRQVTPDKNRSRSKHHLHVSPATILNHLLRASVRPGTWIYVADTVGRLYVGIKSSGAFQHASFLAGARISSAGIIGIEDGVLKYLSPLSGHYRPTTKSFKAFLTRLRDQGVDLGELKISKAYDVLLGMEYYSAVKRGWGRILPSHHREEDRNEGREAKRSDQQHSPHRASGQQGWDEERTHRPRGFTRMLNELHVGKKHEAS